MKNLKRNLGLLVIGLAASQCQACDECSNGSVSYYSGIAVKKLCAEAVGNLCDGVDLLGAFLEGCGQTNNPWLCLKRIGRGLEAAEEIAERGFGNQRLMGVLYETIRALELVSRNDEGGLAQCYDLYELYNKACEVFSMMSCHSRSTSNLYHRSRGHNVPITPYHSCNIQVLKTSNPLTSPKTSQEELMNAVEEKCDLTCVLFFENRLRAGCSFEDSFECLEEALSVISDYKDLKVTDILESSFSVLSNVCVFERFSENYNSLDNKTKKLANDYLRLGSKMLTELGEQKLGLKLKELCDRELKDISSKDTKDLFSEISDFLENKFPVY